MATTPAGAYATLSARRADGELLLRHPALSLLDGSDEESADLQRHRSEPGERAPRYPAQPARSASAAIEVHNQGEVWCVTLWDARANLIAKHGFATGNELILQLVTDGMKLAPANPNFLQARDAILQAELVLTAGANRGELWAAFAKRGMGASATSPASSTTHGAGRKPSIFPTTSTITPGCPMERQRARLAGRSPRRAATRSSTAALRR